MHLVLLGKADSKSASSRCLGLLLFLFLLSLLFILPITPFCGMISTGMGDGSWLSSSRRFGLPRLQARVASVLRGTINLQRFGGGGGGGGWLELSWFMHLGLLDTADSKSASSRCLGLLLLLFLLSLLFILPITPFCGYYPLAFIY